MMMMYVNDLLAQLKRNVKVMQIYLVGAELHYHQLVQPEKGSIQHIVGMPKDTYCQFITKKVHHKYPKLWLSLKWTHELFLL